MTVFQMCVWRMGPHHPVGLTEMQITHHLFYLQAFPSSRRNICKLTWLGWTAGWGLSGFDERFTTCCLLIFSYFLLFVWSLLVICREVSLCLSDERPWDWETWSLWNCTHRWAGGAGSPPPGEGAACPQKEQARWCGYTGMRDLAVPCPTTPCWRSVCHLSLQSLEGGKEGREAENMNRSCTGLSQGQTGVCSHNCP